MACRSVVIAAPIPQDFLFSFGESRTDAVRRPPNRLRTSASLRQFWAIVDRVLFLKIPSIHGLRYKRLLLKQKDDPMQSKLFSLTASLLSPLLQVCYHRSCKSVTAVVASLLSLLLQVCYRCCCKSVITVVASLLSSLLQVCYHRCCKSVITVVASLLSLLLQVCYHCCCKSVISVVASPLSQQYSCR